MLLATENAYVIQINHMHMLGFAGVLFLVCMKLALGWIKNHLKTFMAGMILVGVAIGTYVLSQTIKMEEERRITTLLPGQWVDLYREMQLIESPSLRMLVLEKFISERHLTQSISVRGLAMFADLLCDRRRRWHHHQSAETPDCVHRVWQLLETHVVILQEDVVAATGSLETALPCKSQRR